MLGDCEVIGEEVKPNKMSEKSINALKSPVATSLSSPPPTKKLKQARLSFKILEPKPVTESKLLPTPPSGKKRKHSDTSGGGQKASKLQKSDDGAKVKQPKHEDAENEVSSSSEAELVGKAFQDQRVGKPRGLDRFVQSTQQLEVSTSCADVVDLTGDNSSESADLEKTEVTKEPTTKATKAAQSKEAKCADSDKTATQTTQKDTENIQKDKEADKCPETTKDESKVEPEEGDTSNEQKHDCDNSILDSTMDTSDIVSQSLNETTEASDDEKASESSDDDGSSDTKDTSVCSAAPSTPSTPASRTLKRPPLSATKAKQKEEERQKRNEEKEKAKVEKLRQKEAEKQKKEEMRKERERQKEEREKQKQEEKEKKEQERLQREKERQEKLAEKEKEKEEKLRQKEEEKKKKQEAVEAKLEEKKRKDEEKEAERKKKEEEKLNAEAQKNRKMQGSQTLFKKFFKKVEPTEPVKTTEKVGPFPAFNVLPNMRMAPRVRVSLPTEQCQELDDHLQQQSAAELYIQQLRAGTRSPGVSERTWPAEDDLVILENGADQLPPEKRKAKLLKFHENYRPAYFGTWRKQSKKISPRNPFKKDEEFLDYEVDSDDEWEEEEPGESLSNSEGEGEEGEVEKEDDEEDDGFFVPHGYLSDGEGGEEDEDEDGNPEKMKMRQIIKAKTFEAELKKRTEVLHKMVIGCLWCQGDAQTDARLSPYTASFLIDESPIMIRDATEASTKQRKSKNKSCDKPPKAAKESKGVKAQQVPEEAMEQLIRLVHGNMAGLKKLVREFRVFWSRTQQQKDNPSGTLNTAETSMDLDEDSREKNKRLLTSAEKSESIPENSEKKVSAMETGNTNVKDPDMDTEDADVSSVISKRQMDIKLRSIAVYEKRKGYHKKCWYVNQDVLEKYGLLDLPVPTEWDWITPGPAKKGPAKKDLPDNTATPSSKKQAKEAPSHSTPNNHSIKQFAVPGLVHTYEAVQPAKPTFSSPSASPLGASAKKQAKRITPITLFCAKMPSSENPLKPSAINNNTGKPPVVTKVVKADSSAVIKSSADDDDDCMIVEEVFVPPPPSKSQPTLLSMLTLKNTV